ncbi:hypothetical protein KKY53_10675 [Pseudomonas aeruginosa]|uniref:hypothetical protein n=1 Tax=Gammaproteobacteria TaxID=1236 RepID=UPI00053E8572|nr:MULTISPECIES: hypothetical protein [Gammaproteobacteria]MEE3644754.1 hypothetical protein [Brenneria sp. L3_3C_1]MBJ7223513.1 hypothetical protein [Brenneria sp. L3-3C-1]WCV80988.1 hypothetical protein KKY53_10675 [Pseudomonas aeruginosa]HBO0859708.1 hypothetical protein [Pseudomonas aeruginosa]HCE6879259.1 hypothetical protein [Pseudomonas aeruginosa]
MSQCYVAGDFKKYFDENMGALGLPVPSTMFDSYQTAIGTASTLVGTVATLGKGATVGELIGATVGLEKLAVAASLSAAAYTGAAIGSIAVASGRSLSCGTSIADFLVFTRQTNLHFKGAERFYARNPQVLDGSYPFRSSFGAKARKSPRLFEYA